MVFPHQSFILSPPKTEQISRFVGGRGREGNVLLFFSLIVLTSVFNNRNFVQYIFWQQIIFLYSIVNALYFVAKSFVLWNFIWSIFSYDLIGNPITPLFFFSLNCFISDWLLIVIMYIMMCANTEMDFIIKLSFICLFCSCIFPVNSLFNWLGKIFKVQCLLLQFSCVS